MSVGDSNHRRWLVITVIVAAVFMSNLDLWIVNVAFVDMGRGFHASLSSLSWVLNAYAVTLAALLIPGGRLGDRIGHRRVFLVGITVFTLASVACALAPNVGVLVFARIVQAAGAAAQLPTSLALLLAAVPESARTSAARGWSAVGALSAVAGPVLGGLLVSISWRWVFLVNLPVGVLTVIAGRSVLPHPPAREREPLPDLVGSVLLIVAVASLTGALVQAPTWGWTAPRTVGLVAVAVVGAVAFVRRCMTHPHPMVELPLLQIRRFAMANAATVLFSVAFGIMLLSNALWCQDVWHYSALRTGLAMAPGPAMVPIVTFASARLVARIGSGPVAAIGSVVFGAGLAWLVALAGTTPDYLRELLPSMIIGGIGVGLALSTLIAAGATALPDHRAATGSAFINSARQIASALGVAVLVTILGSRASVLHNYDLAWTVAAALAVVCAAVSLALPAASPATDEARAVTVVR
ncbi:MFS transporter [Leekyejoonella antrihumi]|uniref:MFS transporter n=1 Tax=Leekyejoonella antrihumi TaxID=1660198 RepID=A0A563DUE0_9MICO|nr:MFS transporter [Leekyejoonella antrihumi]TWP33877.1 MFS transporter [Leekyejoonella antrihumi]